MAGAPLYRISILMVPKVSHILTKHMFDITLRSDVMGLYGQMRPGTCSKFARRHHAYVTKSHAPQRRAKHSKQILVLHSNVQNMRAHRYQILNSKFSKQTNSGLALGPHQNLHYRLRNHLYIRALRVGRQTNMQLSRAVPKPSFDPRLPSLPDVIRRARHEAFHSCLDHSRATPERERTGSFPFGGRHLEAELLQGAHVRRRHAQYGRSHPAPAHARAYSR